MYNKEKANKLKNRIQKKAAKKFIYNPFLLLQWPTGFGKAKGVIDCIRADFEDKNNFIPYTIVVPEIAQINNYKKEIETWAPELLKQGAIKDIICYASLNKLKNKRTNLVLNEVQHLSEKRASIVPSINYKKIIADTATLPEDVEERLYSIECFFSCAITLNEAVKMGVIPPSSITVVYIENFDSEKIKEINNKMRKVITSKYNPYRSKEITMKSLGAKRKRIIAEEKTPHILSLLEKGEKRERTLVFCGSIDQCNDISKENSIHSKKTKKQNNEIIEKFNNEEINTLVTNKMGQEGLNLTKVDKVIITQLSTGKDKALELIQKIGRGLRKAHTKIYILSLMDKTDLKNVQGQTKHFNMPLTYKYIDEL